MGKRLEYVVLEQNLVTEQLFQDASRNLSLDYFEGTSEVLTRDEKERDENFGDQPLHGHTGREGLGKEMWVKAIHNSGRYAQQG